MAVLMGIYREYKLTPKELKAVAEKTNNILAQKPDYIAPPEVQHNIASRLAEQMEVSLAHGKPTKLTGTLETSSIARSQYFLSKMAARAYAISGPQRY